MGNVISFFRPSQESNQTDIEAPPPTTDREGPVDSSNSSSPSSHLQANVRSSRFEIGESALPSIRRLTDVHDDIPETGGDFEIEEVDVRPSAPSVPDFARLDDAVRLLLQQQANVDLTTATGVEEFGRLLRASLPEEVLQTLRHDPEGQIRAHVSAQMASHLALPENLRADRGFLETHFNRSNRVGIIHLERDATTAQAPYYEVVNVGGKNFAVTGPDSRIVDPESGTLSDYRISWPDPAGGRAPSIVSTQAELALAEGLADMLATDDVTLFLAASEPAREDAVEIFPGSDLKFRTDEIDGTKVLEFADDDGSKLRLAGVKKLSIDSTYGESDGPSALRRYGRNTAKNYSWIWSWATRREPESPEPTNRAPTGRDSALEHSPLALSRTPENRSPFGTSLTPQDQVRFVVEYEHGGTDVIDVERKGEEGDYGIRRTLGFSRLAGQNNETQFTFNYDGRKGEGAIVLADSSKKPIATVIVNEQQWSGLNAQASHALHTLAGQVSPGSTKNFAGILLRLPIHTYIGLQIVQAGNLAGSATVRNALGIDPPSFLGSGPNAQEATPKILNIGIPASAVGRTVRNAAEASGSQAVASGIEALYMQTALPLGVAVAGVATGAVEGWKQAGLGFLAPNIIAIVTQTLMDHLGNEGMSPAKSQAIQFGLRVGAYGLASAILQNLTSANPSSKLLAGFMIQQLFNEGQIALRLAVAKEQGRYLRNEEALNQQLVQVQGADAPRAYRFSEGLHGLDAGLQNWTRAGVQGLRDNVTGGFSSARDQANWAADRVNDFIRDVIAALRDLSFHRDQATLGGDSEISGGSEHVDQRNLVADLRDDARGSGPNEGGNG